MRNTSLYIFLAFFYFTNNLSIFTESAQPIASSNSTNFIKSSCRGTRYPTLCIKSLSSYATKIQQNETQLAQAAIQVTFNVAQSTTTFVSKLAKAKGIKPREFQAIKDCTNNMAGSLNQLSRSIVEMGRVAGQDLMRMDNVQTWISTALTAENTCLDGFSGDFMNGNIKVAVTRRVIYVSQITSNALALINRYAARHKAAATPS
ncbi:hypothetical protein Leryth_016703 [Lithospermum erythrorhizon]|nr:hypothetical protein Leryth_016703 [Lithospermum erythrorhizon]